MKSFLCLIAFLLLLGGTAISQKNKKTETPAAPGLYEVQEKAYRMALSYYDFPAARCALMQMIVIKPEETGLKDTLALLYFTEKLYPQAIMVANEIMLTKPNDENCLQILAESHVQLGRAAEALTYFSQLYTNTGDVLFLYKKASLEYSLKRINECSVTLNELVNHADAAGTKVAIGYPDGSTQEVSIAAASLNIAGVLSLDMGKKEDAKLFFTKALEIEPTFALSKNNLDAISQTNEGAANPGGQ